MEKVPGFWNCNGNGCVQQTFQKEQGMNRN